MRHFIYFSSKARTSGKALSQAEGNLMKAGRMDIAIHVIIAGLFLSHSVRENVKIHLVFYGSPDPPKHIEMQVKKIKGLPETGSKVGQIDISKKDIGGLIKRILYKYKPGKKTEPFPGCFVEKKSLLNVINELKKEGEEIFVLDKKGEDIRNIDIPEDSAFILGDHEGLPKKELKRLKNSDFVKRVSIGPRMYFASQVVAIVNNELDRRVKRT